MRAVHFLAIFPLVAAYAIALAVRAVSVPVAIRHFAFVVSQRAFLALPAGVALALSVYVLACVRGTRAEGRIKSVLKRSNKKLFSFDRRMKLESVGLERVDRSRNGSDGYWNHKSWIVQVGWLRIWKMREIDKEQISRSLSMRAKNYQYWTEYKYYFGGGDFSD